ncbi:GlxA family transcriptional regulator [Sporomusa rhizae]|uniref:GlxA family transcriptional regulator n=1 Tax=Sporomusa rhizae TaxID=357999 RepID=UPI00352A0BFF
MTINANNPPNIHQPHTVAVVVFDGVVPSDFSTPCDIFKYVKLASGQLAYDIKVCGAKRQIETDLFSLRAPFTLSSLQDADTIILPGISDLDQAIPEDLIRAIRRAFVHGTRIASICTGAFILAATGLLNGLNATTHWLAAPELARRYPTIAVDPNVLYVDNGNLLTSAGASAGLDLCLHIIRRDYGATVAADAARSAVMPLVREGGQAQFIQYKQPPNDNDSLQPLLSWIEENLDQNLNVKMIADQVSMSVRSLQRRFVERLGTTPASWILHSRIRRAQHLLETTRHSIEWISVATGFGSIANFRSQFRKKVGTNPREYRRSFNLVEP